MAAYYRADVSYKYALIGKYVFHFLGDELGVVQAVAVRDYHHVVDMTGTFSSHFGS